MNKPGMTRVVLLAREGDARDRLSEALGAVGADLALAADPLSADPQSVADARPQAVLVALEPAIEDALDRFEAVLADPSITVIFDEAELAAQRAGWDAARWVRHLSAKLNRHDNVLPPGLEAEGEWQPSPGGLPSRAAPPPLDLARFADEAEAHAAEVPRDDSPLAGFVQDQAGATVADATDTADAGTPDVPDAPAWELAIDDAADQARERAGVQALDEETSALDETESGQAIGNDALTLDETGLSFASDQPLDAAAAQGARELEDLDSVSLSPAQGEGDKGEGFSIDTSGELDLVDLDALLASADTADGDEEGGELLLHNEASLQNAASRDEERSNPVFGEETGTEPTPTAALDLEALDARVSSLSLVDTDSYGQGPLRGAVLIEGGLGGPDAVRQLLAALPEDFPRAVLVRLQLDGGRYDRLVKQMERASTLPVALAEAGLNAGAGTVYFMPPGLSVSRERGQLSFVEDDANASTLVCALPAHDSAVLLMSGSDPSAVEAVMTLAADGALVAGQSSDTCYDAAAAAALIECGAAAGTPAELVERLIERWPA